MANIEQKNIESSSWWWASEKIDYSKILWKEEPEIGQKETIKAQKEAEDLLKQIEWTETKKNTWIEQNISQKNIWTLSPDITTRINKLNRPVAQQWLENSYRKIQDDTNTMNQLVQNSKSPGRIKKAANRLFQE